MSALFLRGSLLVVLTFVSLLPTSAVADTNLRETQLVRAVRQSRKSVVNIHTEKTAADDKDSRFFTPRSRKVTGMGTGIVIDERGYIVTNYHVIQDVDVITVTIDGGSTFEAQPVSYDRKHDLAIIRVNSKEPLTVMQMGTSSDLMLAETVYAVGNAFGYEDTITEGIVSALHRDVEVDETQSYENLIQTSASINPGNSGGPLLNLNGEVIGINVAIRSGAQRIGFAIPIDDARRTIARLMSVERLNGMPHGLSTEDIKSTSEKKLLVQDVHSGSAADLCGIKAGDVIRTIRGMTILDSTDLERSLLDLPQGRVVDVVLVREGREQTMQFTIGVGKNLPAATARAVRDIVVPGADSKVSLANPATSVAAKPPTAQVPPSTGSQTAQLPGVPAIPVSNSSTASPETLALNRAWDLLGLKLEALSETERREITSKVYNGVRGQVRYNGGMRIADIRPGSSASQTLQKGDVLLGLNGFETLSVANLQYLLDDARIGNASSMKCQTFRRGNGPMESMLQVK